MKIFERNFPIKNKHCRKRHKHLFYVIFKAYLYGHVFAKCNFKFLYKILENCNNIDSKKFNNVNKRQLRQLF